MYGEMVMIDRDKARRAFEDYTGRLYKSRGIYKRLWILNPTIPKRESSFP